MKFYLILISLSAQTFKNVINPIDHILDFAYPYTIFLYLFFAILVGLVIYHLPLGYRFLKKLPREYLLALLCVFCLGAGLRFSVIPHKHSIYYDELYFMNVSRNLYYQNAYGETFVGSERKPEEIQFYKRPGAWPFLLNIFYRFFGDSEDAAFALTALLSSLVPIIISLACYLLFKDPHAAFWSGLTAAVYPLYLRFSGCAASDIPTFFFFCASFLLGLCYNRTRSLSLLYLATVFVLWTAYMRPENLLWLLILALFIFKHADLSKPQKELWLYFIFALSIPLVLQIGPMIKSENASAGNTFWNLKFIVPHFFNNIAKIADLKNNLFFNILALCGGFACFRQSRKAFYALVALFFGLLLLYSGFYGGFFANTLERYFLPGSLPYLLFMALGLKAVTDQKNKFIKFILTALVTVCLIYSTLLTPFMGNQRQNKPLSLMDLMNKRLVDIEEYAFLKNLSPLLNKDLYILTDGPAIVTTIMSHKVMPLYYLDQKKDLLQEVYLIKLAGQRDNDFSKKLAYAGVYYEKTLLAQKTFPGQCQTMVWKLKAKPINAPLKR